MSYHKRLQAIVALAICCSASGTASASLLSNGSFESLPPERGCASATTSLPGWAVDAGNIDVDSNRSGCGPYDAADGKYYVDLTGTGAAGSIYQDVDTTPGDWYRLQFYWTGNPAWQTLSYDNDGSFKGFDLDIGTVLDESIQSLFEQPKRYGKDTATVDAKGPLDWQLESLLFEATGETTRIRFTSINGENNTVYGPFLDGVSLDRMERMERTGSAPIPATFGLVGIGLAGIGMARRRNR